MSVADDWKKIRPRRQDAVLNRLLLDSAALRMHERRATRTRDRVKFAELADAYFAARLFLMGVKPRRKRKIPKALRDEIWRHYRPGQEERGDPSEGYLDVARRVQEWIAANGARPDV